MFSGLANQAITDDSTSESKPLSPYVCARFVSPRCPSWVPPPPLPHLTSWLPPPTYLPAPLPSSFSAAPRELRPQALVKADASEKTKKKGCGRGISSPSLPASHVTEGQGDPLSLPPIQVHARALLTEPSAPRGVRWWPPPTATLSRRDSSRLSNVVYE